MLDECISRINLSMTFPRFPRYISKASTPGFPRGQVAFQCGLEPPEDVYKKLR